jgi:hypothetical protein
VVRYVTTQGIPLEGAICRLKVTPEMLGERRSTNSPANGKA